MDVISFVVKKVNATYCQLMMEDGNTLTIPLSEVEHLSIKKGSTIYAEYEDRGGVWELVDFTN